MAIKIIGYDNNAVVDVHDTSSRSLNITKRPVDTSFLGSYIVNYSSGTMTAGMAANGDIFQFRWADPHKFAIIHEVRLMGLIGSATVFTAGFGKVDMMVHRSWTAIGSGGNPITLTANNCKKRTSMMTTSVNDIRAAATAPNTAGTRTSDANPIGQVQIAFGTAPSVQYCKNVYLFSDKNGRYPLVFNTFEGFSVRATVPATGTWQFAISMAWSEVLSY